MRMAHPKHLTRLPNQAAPAWTDDPLVPAMGAVIGGTIGAFGAALAASGVDPARRGRGSEGYTQTVAFYMVGGTFGAVVGAAAGGQKVDTWTAIKGAFWGSVISHSMNLAFMWADEEWVPTPGALMAGAGSYAALSLPHDFGSGMFGLSKAAYR